MTSIDITPSHELHFSVMGGMIGAKYEEPRKMWFVEDGGRHLEIPRSIGEVSDSAYANKKLKHPDYVDEEGDKIDHYSQIQKERKSRRKGKKVKNNKRKPAKSITIANAACSAGRGWNKRPVK